MITKNPLVALSSSEKASRVKIDTPGKPPDPASIRYGGKAPKSERTAPAAAPAALPATPTTPPAQPATPAATVPTATPARALVSPPSIPPAPPTRPVGRTAWPPTRAALDNAPPPSRRSLAGRYGLVPYGPGLLPDPGPPTGPEHWGLNCPPPGGPVLALVGQYGEARRGTAPLLSVSFACNFGLREPGLREPGPQDSGGPFSVGVMLPTAAAPYRPDLGQLIGLALREAAVSPRRFRPGVPGAAPDTLTLLLLFVEPGGETLRRLFGPPLPPRPLPTCLAPRVPDFAGSSHKVTAEAYDAGRLPRPRPLADAQCFLAIDRGREAAGDMALVADLLADPAALLSRDPERYGRAAAQTARLLILGRRPYRLSALP